MVKRTIFDAVKVSYLPKRAVDARDELLEVSMDADLEEVDPASFQPLFVTDDLYRNPVGGLYVRNDVIYSVLPDAFVASQGLRTTPPGSSVILDDARPLALGRLQDWAANGLAANGLAAGPRIYVPAPAPCARLLYLGWTKVKLLQFANDVSRWRYDGFHPDRKSSPLHPYSRQYFLPLNMTNPGRTSNLVDGILAIGRERTTLGLGALQWRRVAAQRPDLIPRRSEVHAAAVMGQLMMGFACVSALLPVQPEGNELGARCMRDADLTLLGLREPALLGASLRYFRQDHADCFGPHRIHRGIDRMLNRCLYVVENGERVDEAIGGATLRHYTGTDAYEQYLARELVDSDEDTLSIG
jgi:hypothetical protein